MLGFRWKSIPTQFGSELGTVADCSGRQMDLRVPKWQGTSGVGECQLLRMDSATFS